MVHVKKCPLAGTVFKRGYPTTEFYIGAEPQIYCRGYINTMTDEPITECKNCKDWVYGEQCEKDFERWKERRDKWLNQTSNL